MKTTSLAALVAIASAMSLSAVANAADLGGNCCADLEERVAELEATTARKGNRKVKLTVSGQVNEAVIFWDDGAESNAYVVSNNNSRTRFRFVGDAKINADWSAGYLLEIGVRYAASNNRTQLSTGAGGDTNSLDIRHSAWYLNSKTFGRLWVGQTSTATDGITEINLANVITSGADVAQSWNGGYRFRRAGVTGQGGLSALTLNGLSNQISANANVGEGDRNNVVRYISPTFFGFTWSAAWGEDDMWDTALRYAGEFSGFRLAAGIGYRQSRDINANADGISNCANLAGSTNTESAVDCRQIGMSASIMHVPTGLYLSGAYGKAKDDNRKALFGVGGLATGDVDDKESFYYIQGGIEQNWTGLGKTTIYGEYYSGAFGSATSGGGVLSLTATDQLNSLGVAARVQGTDVTVWGIGINQSIDAAAMDLYLAYRSYSYDVTIMNASNLAVTKSRSIDDFQAVMVGGIIRF
jgi:hypothetical protein